ncbi:KxYKxGKxW signal peptide domain-containing protein [Marinobacter sp. LN3S78]
MYVRRRFYKAGKLWITSCVEA